MKRYQFAFIFGVVVTSQAFADIVIKSNVKKASVYEVSDEGVKKHLGETPVKVDSVASGKVLVEKEGHVPVQLLLAPGVENIDLKVDLRPLADWSPEYMRIEASKMADKALDRIVQAQGLLDERKAASARPLIDSLMHDYPSSVAVRILHANYLAISGQAKEALDVYDGLSKQLGPSDAELRRLVDRMIEGLTKIVAKRRSL